MIGLLSMRPNVSSENTWTSTGCMHNKADWNHNRTDLLTDGVDPAQLLISGSVNGGVAYVWLGHIKWRRYSTTASYSWRR